MTAAPADWAIELRHVAKTYRGRVQALQGIALHVRRGEVFGLLGPNGAGKSTLVKILMTVVRPTRAEGTLLGRPIGHKPTLAKVGYLPENHRFPRYLTGRQTLDFFAALAKTDRPTRRRRAEQLLETVGMTAWADARVSTYSKGMMQRIGLAQSLVHDPDLVLLDEPTDGVDPVGRRDILDVLGRLREQGKTVFVNSHALSELETICDRVAILVKGQVVRQGTMDELTIAKQRYEIEVVAADPARTREQVKAAVPAAWAPSPSPAPTPPPLASSGPPPLPYAAPPLPTFSASRFIDRGRLPSGQAIEMEGPVLRVETTDPADVQGVIDSLRHAALVIRRVQPVRPSLEELFLEAVTDPTTGLRATPGAERGRRGERP